MNPHEFDGATRCRDCGAEIGDVLLSNCSLWCEGRPPAVSSRIIAGVRRLVGRFPFAFPGRS